MMKNKILLVILIWVWFSSFSFTYAQNPKIDAKADQLLHSMSDLLGKANAFSFTTSETHDRHKRSGKTGKVSFSRELMLKRPDGLWIKATGEKGGMAGVWYDGKTLTLQSDVEKVFTKVVMPPTLDQALDYTADHLDLPMPMADLFYSSPYKSLVTPETTGNYVKSETIEGTDCAQLSFQDPNVDWRIWIAEKDQPIVCQLELTYKQEEGKPKSFMTFRDWNFSPKVDPNLFTHIPPKGYERIPILGDADPSFEEPKN
jgi:hypothetical protein